MENTTPPNEFDPETLESDITPPTENSLLKNIRTNFLYGLFVILPMIATLGVVYFLINIISGPMSALFGRKIPEIISFTLTVGLITLIGYAAKNIIGKSVLDFFESMMRRIPVISKIYRSSKQVIQAFSFKDKKLLSAVLVEYPRKGAWALAFITNENVTGIIDEKGKDFGKNKVALFVPTTPNPTSGYFIYVDKADIVKISLSVEDSVKVLMSAGVISPEIKK